MLNWPEVITIIGTVITCTVGVIALILKLLPILTEISRSLGRLDSLIEDFNRHRDENREDFRKFEARFEKFEARFDKLEAKIDQIITGKD